MAEAAHQFGNITLAGRGGVVRTCLCSVYCAQQQKLQPLIMSWLVRCVCLYRPLGCSKSITEDFHGGDMGQTSRSWLRKKASSLQLTEGE